MVHFDASTFHLRRKRLDTCRRAHAGPREADSSGPTKRPRVWVDGRFLDLPIRPDL